MQVLRIVPNIQTENIYVAKRFYEELLGLEALMDHGWIRTYGCAAKMDIQISFALEGGGAGTATEKHFAWEIFIKC